VRLPTQEQADVLGNEARLRVVRAAPGSGKTWLAAELIRRELQDWPALTSGIAALSFTRVAGDEIRKAVGYELTHPHFVGTIDAFLFRYVIRPFLRSCFPSFAAPRLIPADFGAEHWTKVSVDTGAVVGKGIPLFGCAFIDEQAGRSVVAYKPHQAAPLQRLDTAAGEIVKEAKRAIWKRSGLLTHSDAALWASKLLEHNTLGSAIRQELVRRFPFIVVDEFQDTGYFLGKSILLLLAEPRVRGVLVGDPDQAIYEFSGARPDLFNRFESVPGAVSLPLARSQRCPPAVIAVASHLKDSPGVVSPAAERTGRAVLLQYTDMTELSTLLRELTAARTSGSTKIVGRHSATVTALAGRDAKPAPKLGCPPLNHLHRGVVAFRQGRQVAAFACARAALELIVFGHEGLDDSKLKASGIDPTEWKDLAVKTLLRASSEPEVGTLYDWQQRLGVLLDDQIANCGFAAAASHNSGKLKPIQRKKTKKDGAASCTEFVPKVGASEPSQVALPVQTVHSVKGETHELTIFVCPDPGTVNRCPSVVWWSTDDKDREEKRIAYVAMTRTRGDLIVCVSNTCFKRLSETRADFVAAFESMTVAEYAGTVINQSPAAV
jgi:DNA helicase II / ATP-dependent DNA helicase PcrA